MLCLGYRTNLCIKVVFPYGDDIPLKLAVTQRLKRFNLGKEKKTTEKTKPFLHSYKIHNDKIVLCVYNHGVSRDSIRMMLKSVLSRPTEDLVTKELLVSILMPYAAPRLRYSIDLGNDSGRNTKIEDVRKQIQEVQGIMRSNIGTVLNRCEKTEDLESQTHQMLIETTSFVVKSTDLKKKERCRYCKLSMLLYCIICCMCLVLIGGGVFGLIKFGIPYIRKQ